MHQALEEALLARASRASCPLIAPSHVERLSAVARMLRAPRDALFGFACGLAEPDPAADIVIWVPLRRRGAACAGHELFDDAALTGPLVPRIGAFCRTYGDPGPPSSPWAVCLRFTCEASVSSPLVAGPSAFFAPPAQEGISRVPDTAWLATMALPSLVGAEQAPDLADILTTCLAALPSGVHILQIGLLLGRIPPCVRVQVWSMAAHRLVSYLTSLGWPGDAGDLSGTLARLAPFSPRFQMHFDVGGAVDPRIGLDFRHPDRGPGRCDDGGRALLCHLVQAQLCLPGKRAALREWPEELGGQANGRLHGPDRRRSGRPVCSLSRLQIAYRPGRPLEALAYLSCSWFRPAGPGARDPSRGDEWC